MDLELKLVYEKASIDVEDQALCYTRPKISKVLHFKFRFMLGTSLYFSPERGVKDFGGISRQQSIKRDCRKLATDRLSVGEVRMLERLMGGSDRLYHGILKICYPPPLPADCTINPTYSFAEMVQNKAAELIKRMIYGVMRVVEPYVPVADVALEFYFGFLHGKSSQCASIQNLTCHNYRLAAWRVTIPLVTFWLR